MLQRVPATGFQAVITTPGPNNVPQNYMGSGPGCLTAAIEAASGETSLTTPIASSTIVTTTGPATTTMVVGTFSFDWSTFLNTGD